MQRFLVRLSPVGGDVFLVEPMRPTDPGFGTGAPPVDPGYGRPGWSPADPGFGNRPPVDPDYGFGFFPHPGNRPPGSSAGHPGNALPIAPVRPSPPIVLPPITTWPPQLPPGVDNSLPPSHGHPDAPIVIPPDPSIGISLPIHLPQLPAGSALIIALPAGAQPKEGVPADAKPAILWQGAGTKPVLVYVTAAPAPTPT